MKSLKKLVVFTGLVSMMLVGCTSTKTEYITMGVGETYTSSLSKQYNATYTTSNKKVATVSKKGKIKAKKVGKATITGKYSGESKKCVVTVKKAVKKVKPQSYSVNLEPYETYAIKVKFLPKKSATLKVTYKSSDPTVAAVNDSGTVTAYKEGNTTITIKTANKKTAKVKIHVDQYE